jgi:hypothetical protein
MQVDPGRFKSLPQGLSLIAKTEGMPLVFRSRETNVKHGLDVVALTLLCAVSHIPILPFHVGTSALFKGWAPTAIGYSAQGLCKFGFYEFFKDMYSTMAGEENAYKYVRRTEPTVRR